MKKLIFVIITVCAFFVASCKKCETCVAVGIGKNIDKATGQVIGDTVRTWSETEVCGRSDIKDAEGSYKTSTDFGTYRQEITVMVNCHPN